MAQLGWMVPDLGRSAVGAAASAFVVLVAVSVAALVWLYRRGAVRQRADVPVAAWIAPGLGLLAASNLISSGLLLWPEWTGELQDVGVRLASEQLRAYGVLFSSGATASGWLLAARRGPEREDPPMAPVPIVVAGSLLSYIALSKAPLLEMGWTWPFFAATSIQIAGVGLAASMAIRRGPESTPLVAVGLSAVGMVATTFFVVQAGVAATSLLGEAPTLTSTQEWAFIDVMAFAFFFVVAASGWGWWRTRDHWLLLGGKDVGAVLSLTLIAALSMYLQPAVQRTLRPVETVEVQVEDGTDVDREARPKK